MKYLILVVSIFLNLPAHSQEASFMHDGDYHYYVDGIEVAAPSIILGDEIMFEHDAKIYLIKNTTAAKNTGKKISGELIEDRTKLKAWGIDFYVERNGLLILYVNGNFYNSDSLFLAAGEAMGYIEPYYFRLGKFDERKENVFGEIVVLPDGIWWNDEVGNLYALRHGKSFNSVPEPFRKGYVAQDAVTKEYIWFNRHSEQNEPKVYLMQVIPEAVAINISFDQNMTNYRFVAKPFYQGKPLGDASVELDMDKDTSTDTYKSMYFYDPDLNKAFWGNYPEYGQTVELIEINVPKIKNTTFWLTDNKGQYYLQNNKDIWRVEKGSYQDTHFAIYDGIKYELLNRNKARSMELHPTRIIE